MVGEQRPQLANLGIATDEWRQRLGDARRSEFVDRM